MFVNGMASSSRLRGSPRKDYFSLSFTVVMKLEEDHEVLSCGTRGDGLSFRRAIK